MSNTFKEGGDSERIHKLILVDERAPRGGNHVSPYGKQNPIDFFINEVLFFGSPARTRT